MIQVATFAVLNLLNQVAGVEVANDYAVTVIEPIARIQTAMGLSNNEYNLAKTAASTFVYVGPCRGTEKTPNGAMSAVQLIVSADPTVKSEAAALEMVGIFLRSNLGRPDPALCDLAFSMAKVPLR